MYDSTVINRNSVLMYGSKKSGEQTRWTVAYTLDGYHADEEETDLEPEQLVDTLSIRKFDAKPILESAMEEVTACREAEAEKARKVATTTEERGEGVGQPVGR